MKDRKLQKRSSLRRGASVLIALLVFFLAALSGTIALTMAASNAGRYTHAQDDQQAYLSVASATKLILSELEDLQISMETTQNPNDSTVAPSEIKTIIKAGNGKLFVKDNRFINNLRLRSYDGWDKSTNAYKNIVFTLTVDGDPDAVEYGFG